jgi:hypothetical protein
MKMHLVVALVGLASSVALPTFGQQTNTPDPALVKAAAHHFFARNLDRTAESEQTHQLISDQRDLVQMQMRAAGT